MARALITTNTKKGDLVVDPFCGCGVVALEAAASGRRVVAGDWNPYAVVLTKAKLFPPNSLRSAEKRLYHVWNLSRKRVADQDLRTVPSWVRKFFHPETLRDALAFRDTCVELNEDFLLACLLGILHHQRPGFLSYPSSHLVPYLRNRKFPRYRFPAFYEKRDVLIRLDAKVRRTFRRPPEWYTKPRHVLQIDAREFPALKDIKAVVTSPPYMNELDYVRDNRLRLWFLLRSLPKGIEVTGKKRETAYVELMRKVCLSIGPSIETGGVFVLVVGGNSSDKESATKSAASLTRTLFDTEPNLRNFKLQKIYNDIIPDIRRSRRECRGIKSETVLVYRKFSNLEPMFHTLQPEALR